VNAFIIKYIDEEFQTEEICLIVVRTNGVLLKYVKNKTYDICIEAIKNNGNALKYVEKDEQTSEMCEIAIKQTPYAIIYASPQYITDDLCLYAVEQEPEIFKCDDFKYVEKQTLKICEIALKSNPMNFLYIKNKDYIVDLAHLLINKTDNNKYQKSSKQYNYDYE
jgi:hypothetical protein